MPWWSVNLWALRLNLRNSYKLKIDSPTKCNVDAYVHIKAVYQRSLRSAKKDSWKAYSSNMNNDIFGELKKLANPSVSNSTPSELVVDGNKISNPTEILSAFSTHFFPANSPDDKLHKSVIDETNSFCDIPLPSDEVYVSLSDVEQAFDSMRLTKSPGPDGISPDWLKLSFNLVKNHHLALFAVCFKLSYFPKHWKIASIIILKKNNKDNEG